MTKKLDDFLKSCDREDIDDLIGWVMETNAITERDLKSVGMSAGERYFEDHLEKIHGKWNTLSKEEEEFIYNIAKRY